MFWTVFSAVFLGVFLAVTLATMPDDVANAIFSAVLFFHAVSSCRTCRRKATTSAGQVRQGCSRQVIS